MPANPFRKKKGRDSDVLSDDEDYPVSPVMDSDQNRSFAVLDNSESNGGWSDDSDDSTEDVFVGGSNKTNGKLTTPDEGSDEEDFGDLLASSKLKTERQKSSSNLFPPSSLAATSLSHPARHSRKSDNDDGNDDGESSDDSDEGYRGAPYMQKTPSRENVFATVPSSPPAARVGVSEFLRNDDLNDHMPTSPERKSVTIPPPSSDTAPISPSRKSSPKRSPVDEKAPIKSFGWFGKKNKKGDLPLKSDDDILPSSENKVSQEYVDEDRRSSGSYGNAPVYDESGEYLSEVDDEEEGKDDFDDDYVPASQRSRRAYRREFDRDRRDPEFKPGMSWRSNQSSRSSRSNDFRPDMSWQSGRSGRSVRSKEFRPDMSWRSGRSSRSNRSSRSREIDGFPQDHPDIYSEDLEGSFSHKNSHDGTAITFLEDQQRKERRFMVMLVACLGCSLVALALLAGGIVGATILGDKKDDEKSSGGSKPATTTPVPVPVPSPTDTPPSVGGEEDKPASTPVSPETEAPTQSGEFIIKDQALYGLIAANTADGGVSISSRNSPQNLAYKWLESDPLQASGISDSRKLQRYALACFYYSADGANWVNSLGWLDESDECLWYNDAGTFSCSGDSLAILEMKLNNVGGVLPPELSLLTGLTRISLYNDVVVGTGFSGGIPKEIGKLSALKEFELEGHAFTDPIPTELFQDWTLLDSLHISACGLQGPIPATIGNLAASTRISLAGNQLSGKIPEEIGNLGNVLQFDLSNNKLSGQIPVTIGNMASVKGIYVNGNDLTGNLPTELGLLKNTKAGLDFSQNKLTGPIPASLGTLVDMKMFIVNNNQLTGTVPDFSALNNLRDFRIDGNSLTGAVPDGTCTAIALKGANAYADCPSPVACPCCTHCCDSSGTCSPQQ